MKGYTVSAYSYDPHCIKCEDYKYNWLKYLAAAFLPLTVFYVVVTLFSISFTSPLLSGVLFVEAGDLYLNPLTVIMSFAAFFNLDFFRAYYSFCLHPSVSAIAITTFFSTNCICSLHTLCSASHQVHWYCVALTTQMTTSIHVNTHYIPQLRDITW